MSLFEAIFLGIVQGMSEFLPISSSGHLLVFHHLFGIEHDSLTFIIVLNMGSLIPLLVTFRKDVWMLIKKPFQRTTALLLVATLPLVIVTILFESYIESFFGSIRFLPFGFILTGVILLLSDRLRDGNKTVETTRFIDAILIGLAQAAAVLPGLSRSGSTITASLARGLDREQAARFSFLMSIPASIGAIAFRARHIVTGRILLEDLDFVNMGFGFVAAAISGFIAINFMLTLVKKAKLKYFAFYYVFALTLLVVVLLLM